LQEKLVDFLKWMELWDDVNAGGKYKHLSSSTRLGLEITIKATLRLFDFLVNKHNFRFLMTARLNQDPLEVSNMFYNAMYI
jgi:hypothetical protein